MKQDKRGSEGWKDPKYEDFEIFIVIEIRNNGLHNSSPNLLIGRNGTNRTTRAFRTNSESQTSRIFLLLCLKVMCKKFLFSKQNYND